MLRESLMLKENKKSNKTESNEFRYIKWKEMIFFELNNRALLSDIVYISFAALIYFAVGIAYYTGSARMSVLNSVYFSKMFCLKYQLL